MPTRNGARIYKFVSLRAVFIMSMRPISMWMEQITTIKESLVSSGFPSHMVCGVRNRYRSQFRPLPVGLHQCHPNSMLRERHSDQSHHLRMETGTHNRRHTTYKHSCCTVTTATGCAGSGGGGASSSL